MSRNVREGANVFCKVHAYVRTQQREKDNFHVHRKREREGEGERVSERYPADARWLLHNSSVEAEVRWWEKHEGNCGKQAFSGKREPSRSSDWKL